MLYFIVGLLVGTVLGASIMALIYAASETDRIRGEKDV